MSIIYAKIHLIVGIIPYNQRCESNLYESMPASSGQKLHVWLNRNPGHVGLSEDAVPSIFHGWFNTIQELVSEKR
jgi:hypothetical protein